VRLKPKNEKVIGEVKGRMGKKKRKRRRAGGRGGGSCNCPPLHRAFLKAPFYVLYTPLISV